MERPERPSRHRSHDKWKRIIEPAGDSDSSEWSSDSDVGLNSFRSYRHLDFALGGDSSSNGNREQHSPINATMSSSSQNKQSREPPPFMRTLETYSFLFDPRVSTKRFEGFDPGAGTSASSSYNHLLHHDYAEREVNSDRSTNESFWFHRPIFNPLMSIGRKRQRHVSNRNDSAPTSVIDCSVSTNTPSTSNSVVTNSPIERMIHDLDDTSSNNSAVSMVVNHEDDGLGLLSNERVNRSLHTSESSTLGSAEIPDNNEHGTTLPGATGIAVPSSSVQTQAGQNDCTVTSATVDPLPHSTGFFCPPDWYVQKKVQSRNKRVRFSDDTFRRSTNEPSSLPEDYSTSAAARTPEDASEIQVLSMAGPSNGSSRIVYPYGPRIRMGNETSSATDEPTQSVVEGEDEGVEVIMVDDPHPESSSNKPPSTQEQGPPQILIVHHDPSRNEYFIGPTRKRQKEDEEQLNQGLIGLLECPVCMEYMGPPIHQCRRGHLVCSSCKPKLPSCPTCRSRFTESRNLAMEKVADKLHYPCKNAHVGCLDTLRLRDKDEHEANCAFRSYRCIRVPPCDWKGQHSEILPHVLQSHSDTLLEGPEHVLEIRLGDFTEQCIENWVLSALGELFRVNFGAVHRNDNLQIYGCVLHLGPARRAPLFRYSLTVRPPEGDLTQRQISYSRTTHCYVERCSIYYAAGDSLHLNTETAQHFCTGPPSDRKMSVKLLIEKIEP